MQVTSELKAVELEDDKENNYQLVFNCTYEEFMYGQDADNNRGKWRKEMVHFELVFSYINGTEVKSTEIPIDIMKRAEKEVWE